MDWYQDWFNSKYYDILYKHRDNKEAKLFIDELLSILKPSKKHTFLDLGCGNGRHSIYLNTKGFLVDGIDLSKKNIQQAKIYENETLKFIEGDMRSFNLNKKYNIILNLFTSFGYFEDDNDNKKVFQNTYNHLNDGGYFIIDFLNKKKVINSLKASEIKKINGVLFQIKKKHNNKFVYKHISITDKKNKFTFTERVRLIDKNQFLTYLNDLEMNLLYTFGDYKLNQYTPSSDRLLLVFQKKKSNK